MWYLLVKCTKVCPWEILCVDLVGPYTICRPNKPDLVLKACTMIDPATLWFEIAEIDNKQSDTVANTVEQEWFTRYPWPDKCIFDHGSKFLGREFQDLLKKEYNVKTKPITVKNPQANAVLERVHQVLGNLIRTFELKERNLNKDDSWSGILAVVAWAIHSTFYTTLQATPGQLVFC